MLTDAIIIVIMKVVSLVPGRGLSDEPRWGCRGGRHVSAEGGDGAGEGGGRHVSAEGGDGAGEGGGRGTTGVVRQGVAGHAQEVGHGWLTAVDGHASPVSLGPGSVSRSGRQHHLLGTKSCIYLLIYLSKSYL